MDEALPSILYQYRNNNTAFKIIENKTIRLSDIRKSNDFMEMQMFFPDVFSAIVEVYQNEPFDIEFEEMKDVDAIRRLNYRNYNIINSYFEAGDFTNYVACFSEEGDLLSQWRGYADDGKGCCIGYSRELLEEYCEKTGKLLQLKKVEYITMDEAYRLNRGSNACFILRKLKENFEALSKDYEKNSEQFNTTLSYYYRITLKIVLNYSLSYKLKEFEEEKEWRLFLADKAYKSPEYVLEGKGAIEQANGSFFTEVTAFLRNKTQFQLKDDDIVSYIEIEHKDFSEQPIKEVCMGPKNKVQKADLKLFLKANDYSDVRMCKSVIPYC